jgi:hypothetical protein
MINDIILKDPDINCVVHSAVIETYLNHVVPDNIFNARQIEHFRILIGAILQRQGLLTENKLLLAKQGHNPQLVDQCDILRNELPK